MKINGKWKHFGTCWKISISQKPNLKRCFHDYCRFEEDGNKKTSRTKNLWKRYKIGNAVWLSGKLPNPSLTKKRRVFINNCPRKILGIYLLQRISNEELWRKCGHIPVADTIELREFGWIGHTPRRKNIARLAVKRKRKQGRQKTTWRSTVEKEGLGVLQFSKKLSRTEILCCSLTSPKGLKKIVHNAYMPKIYQCHLWCIANISLN